MRASVGQAWARRGDRVGTVTFVGRLGHVVRSLRGLFDRRSRALAKARRAELEGELEAAIVLFERVGRSDEVHRVRRARALAALAASGAPVTSSGRIEMTRVAAELESLGDFGGAAVAYARAGDLDGQARALGSAGEVDRLEELLAARVTRSHEDLARRAAHDLFAMLVASGQRREAVALARVSSDDGLRSRGRDVEAKRVVGPVVRAIVRGRPHLVVLGDRVVLGRARAESVREPLSDESPTILVASTAVSRRHLSITRRDGAAWVGDLGSHNGTTLRGTELAEEVRVGEGIELRLGDEVSVVVRPAVDWPGAIALEVAGASYVVPLGPVRLGIGPWRLEYGSSPPQGSGDDEGRWVELVTGAVQPAFSCGLQLAGRVALLAGDAIAAERGGEIVLTVLSPED